MMSEDLELRRRATRRADLRLALRSHIATFVVVNAGLFAIDWFTGGGINWAYWPLFGWGIGLVAHILSVNVELEGARERLIQEEMEKLRRRDGVAR
jgi:hypothetical protein